MLTNNEKGQSLIEVLVVGVVSAIMILSLIIIILNSLKNAQFAQNQVQATKYAQDALDKIRILRDDNKNGTLTPYTSPKKGCFIELWNNANTSEFYCNSIALDPFCYFNLNASSPSILDKIITGPTNVSIPGGLFTRQIKVSQPTSPVPTDFINLVVTVNWSDSSGSHSSQLETIITKPNYDCIE